MRTTTRTEPRSRISFALSIGMHLAFVAVLVFAISWKTKPPAPVIAELWTPPPAAKPQPVPKPKPAPPPKVVPPPEPKVETKPPEKVDIALEQEKERKRLEEERKRLEALEQKRREEARKRELEEERKAEDDRKRKAEEARKRAEAEQKRKEEEARAKVEREKKAAEARNAADKRLAAELERDRDRMMREQLERELGKAPAQAARRDGVAASVPGDPSATAGYVDKIRGKIRGNVILPTALAGNPEAEFIVQQLPTGEILNVRLARSSGNKSLDAAWERAILKSSPLPLPEQRDIFQSTLRLKFRPSDK